MSVKSIRDVLAGILLLGIGAAAGFASLGYGVGSPRAIEPGFFPLILGGMIAAAGVGVLLSGVDFRGRGAGEDPIRLDRGDLWRLAVLTGGFALFGWLLPFAGLFLTCFATIAAVSLGARMLSLQGALLTAAILSSAAVVLFRHLLDLQVPAWPWGG